MNCQSLITPKIKINFHGTIPRHRCCHMAHMNSITSLSVQPITLSPLLCFRKEEHWRAPRFDWRAHNYHEVSTLAPRNYCCADTVLCLPVCGYSKKEKGKCTPWQKSQVMHSHTKKVLGTSTKSMYGAYTVRSDERWPRRWTTVGMFSFGMYAAKKNHIRTAVRKWNMKKWQCGAA